MGIRAHQPHLTALLAAALLSCAGLARAADAVSVSTGSTVSVSTGSSVALSTSAAASVSSQTASTSAFPLPVLPVSPATTSTEQLQQKLAADAVQALRDLAAFYSQKRRTPFMKLVSDDFNGDLGTLEDALSSDFRSYRTIDLQIRPDNSVAHGEKATVQFTYDLTIANDQGVNTKFSGHASYIFRQEGKKVMLYQMSNNPIFGTSLSSIENPVAKSQGTPTQSQPAGTTATPGCTSTTLRGSGVLHAGATGFKFDTQANVAEGQSDVCAAAGNLEANAGGGIVDVGTCSLASFSTPPASITGTSAFASVGDCYAIKTLSGKYAAILITGLVSPGDISTANFNYEFQPSGARCF
jgi:hypothetical protein